MCIFPSCITSMNEFLSVASFIPVIVMFCLFIVRIKLSTVPFIVMFEFSWN